MKLIATKRMIYATRHLVAGDPFEASNRDARILIGIRKAKAAAAKAPRLPKAVAAPPLPPSPPPTSNVSVPDEPSQVTPVSGDEIARLRNTARRLGLVVDKRWGSQRLRDEIAKARGF